MHAHRFEAIVFDLNETLAAGPVPVRKLLERASACALELALVSEDQLATAQRSLPAQLDGPGGLLLALNGGVELHEVDREGWRRVPAAAAVAAGQGATTPTGNGRGRPSRSDCLSLIMGWLWERGIAPSQVLIANEGPGAADGVRCPEGGLDAFVRLVQDQIARRCACELPVAVQDPAWTLVVERVDARLERAHESLLTLADGRLGTRGSTLVPHPSSDPAGLMAGIYARSGEESRLLSGPRWNRITGAGLGREEVRRTLDLHSGVLRQQLQTPSGTTALQFSSLADPGTAVMRVCGDVVQDGGAPLEAPPKLIPETGRRDGMDWMRVTSAPASIVAAVDEQRRGSVLDRVAAYEAVERGQADEERALRRLGDARVTGFDGLLAAHRRAWASRWRDSDIEIAGDPALQQAVRLALFHLMGSAAEHGDAAVGARGLTGMAYRGHVFWDSDVYVLPFLAATHPRAARAMLEYRLRRLPVAMRIAGSMGRAGARFPWESARSGKDVTPAHLRDSNGNLVRVLTGELEEHIVADIAWATACYIDWSGDHAFARGAGSELLVQTARWWASRMELDDQGRGHIRGVIGPDEYHVGVDDNAFTNVMARWNLRHAARLVGDAIAERERTRWFELADAIVDGYDSGTGVYEQFAGFHDLEQLLISELTPRRPVAADMLLGHERVAGAQVLKQADVLMLHYLVPGEVAAGSLQPNLDFYEPRTAHGSTLSPGVHAALLARAGRLDDAVELLRLAARIDLDDIGQSTAGGLHLASMGSVWRALVYGLAGLQPEGDALAIGPVLPPSWDALDVRLRFRGSRVRLRLSSEGHVAAADPAVTAITSDGTRIELTPTPCALPASSTRSVLR